jgi:hypothetical protein
MTHIVANAKGKYQVGSALLAGCDVRISGLSASRSIYPTTEVRCSSASNAARRAVLSTR